jgi:hypothetical protein
MLFVTYYSFIQQSYAFDIWNHWVSSWLTKSKNTVILSVIHHRQNPMHPKHMHLNITETFSSAVLNPYILDNEELTISNLIS